MTRTPQSDSLFRHVLKSCATKEQKAVIIAAFAKAEQLTGSKNAIGNLEAICMEFLSS